MERLSSALQHPQPSPPGLTRGSMMPIGKDQPYVGAGGASLWMAGSSPAMTNFNSARERRISVRLDAGLLGEPRQLVGVFSHQACHLRRAVADRDDADLVKLLGNLRVGQRLV